ncbi:MAG: methyltransferase domain-containing protein, partial [Candidatus Sumerlaeota bacterium]|nr:methyltransferase domain-containing protein [Candidatus Sumerlaeota bacterium]
DSQYLPFPNATFDIVFQCITFSSILEKAVRRNIGMEIMRVLAPKGFIIWIDSGDSNDKSQYCGEVFYQGIDFPEIRKEIFPGADIIRFPKILLKKDIFRKCLKSANQGENKALLYTSYSRIKYLFYSLFNSNRRHEVLVIRPRHNSNPSSAISP